MDGNCSSVFALSRIIIQCLLGGNDDALLKKGIRDPKETLKTHLGTAAECEAAYLLNELLFKCRVSS
jgi:hypothetical protein